MCGENSECGIDEAGRGPVIGPLVVSIVCGKRDVFTGMGARDSKKLTPSSREHLFPQIISAAEYVKTEVIEAGRLNLLMESENLNEIELSEYVSLAKSSPEGYPIYVDSFDVLPERLGKFMEDKTGRKVVSLHKADEMIPVVSAASIISKVVRDREIKKIEEEYGPIGSGYPSDSRTVEFIERSIRSGKDISGIVRTKWKTYLRIVSNLHNSTLF
jgi:ribonuclease HII